MRRRLLIAATLAAVLTIVMSASPAGPAAAARPVPVAIVGDSIVAGNIRYLTAVLDERGVPERAVDALSARKTSIAWTLGSRLITSGVDAVRAVRARGLEPDLWVIELGTNDSYDISTCRCPDPVAFAGVRIDALRAELGQDARVLWVNVRTSSPGAIAYNEALLRRVGPRFVVADWKAFTQGRSSWFVDGVHPTATGARMLGLFLADAILAMPPDPTPLPDHCSPGDPGGVAPVPSSLAVGTAMVAARRCRLG